MTKCKKCNIETYSLNLEGLCFECWTQLHPEELRYNNPVIHDLLNKMNSDYLQESLDDVDRVIKKYSTRYPLRKAFLKVQFFEDISLITIQNQMNKFFEDEKISRVVRIEYLKDNNNRYSVMVVYYHETSL